MREYRGKRIDNGEWAYGDSIKNKDKYFIHPQANVFKVENGLAKIMVCHEVIPETVGQFAGLTDKNGKKIFEGDIVKNARYREMPFIVKYVQSRGGYFPFASGDGCGCCEIETITPDENGQVDVEVIGNLHNNPELLTD